MNTTTSHPCFTDAPDYHNLPIPVPAWAVDMVGADYVRSLGLKP